MPSKVDAGALCLVAYNGAATLAGQLTHSTVTSLMEAGVEVLVGAANVDTSCLSALHDSGTFCARCNPFAEVEDKTYAVLYLKDYSEDEMLVNTGGVEGFHPGYSLSSFIAAFPTFVNLTGCSAAAETLGLALG